MSEEDDDIDDRPQLSADTFKALMEFYDQEERINHKQFISSELLDDDFSFSENWQLSQFWYDDETIDVLVEVTLKAAGLNGKIALLSCPSLYRKMKLKAASQNCEISLFEHDRRFEVFGKDFVPYDYKSPLSIPRDKSSYYDIVIADPPFLSDECLTKSAVTIKYLMKEKIILCTGAVMSDLAERLLDLKKSMFKPNHRNNLANEFCCYTNFDMDSLL